MNKFQRIVAFLSGIVAICVAINTMTEFWEKLPRIFSIIETMACYIGKLEVLLVVEFLTSFLALMLLSWLGSAFAPLNRLLSIPNIALVSGAWAAISCFWQMRSPFRYSCANYDRINIFWGLTTLELNAVFLKFFLGSFTLLVILWLLYQKFK